MIVAEEITRASKSVSEGALLKQCMLKVHEQVQTFNNISLSRNTIVESVKELAGHLATELAEEACSYLDLSLAVEDRHSTALYFY